MVHEDSGYIMQIQNFSVNDGDGIRTSIFMCGCPLKCAWCCNPEHARYFDRDHLMTLDEVDRQVSRMAPFFRRGGGGVTFSGGECTFQEGFLRSMTDRFYDKGYHLAMETCGEFDFGRVRDILDKMDQVFYDLKLADSDLHRRYTGAGNEGIAANLARVASLDCQLIVRIPVIIGINADEQNLRSSFRIIRDRAPGASLEFLPYHRLGEDKYLELGLTRPSDLYPMDTPSDEDMAGYASLAGDYGIRVVSYK